MKILITGAAGGIGSTLALALHKQGHELKLVDNCRNGYRENLEHLSGDLCTISITDAIHLNMIVANFHADIIIHLAAITSLPDCEKNKLDCIDINVRGTANILELARRYSVKKVIFASTSAVYENTVAYSYTENMIVNPTLFYSSSKKMAEDLCNTYIQNYGMDIVIFRLFNVFGPRQDIHRPNPPLINYIVRELLANKTPTFYASPKAYRDYIYINDVINYFELAINKEIKPGTYNVCSGLIFNVRDIYNIIKSELKSNIEPIFKEPHLLWENNPIPGLNEEVVRKETEKFCRGSNLKIKKEFKLPISFDMTAMEFDKYIRNTVKEIKRIHG